MISRLIPYFSRFFVLTYFVYFLAGLDFSMDGAAGRRRGRPVPPPSPLRPLLPRLHDQQNLPSLPAALSSFLVPSPLALPPVPFRLSSGPRRRRGLDELLCRPVGRGSSRRGRSRSGRRGPAFSPAVGAVAPPPVALAGPAAFAGFDRSSSGTPTLPQAGSSVVHPLGGSLPAVDPLRGVGRRSNRRHPGRFPPLLLRLYVAVLFCKIVLLLLLLALPLFCRQYVLPCCSCVASCCSTSVF